MLRTRCLSAHAPNNLFASQVWITTNLLLFKVRGKKHPLPFWLFHPNTMSSRTGCLFSIVPRIDVAFTLSIFGSSHLLHLVNLRNAQFGIKSKVHFPFFDGQVMVAPVPQLLQVLVVQHIKRVIPKKEIFGRGKKKDQSM